MSLHHKNPTGIVDHFAIGVENFNKARVTEQLKAFGITPEENLDAGFHIKDPEGMNVQIMRRVEKGGPMMLCIAGFLLAAGVVCAQTQPKFEVASIKPSNSADQRRLFDIQPGGRVTVANFTVKRLIESAYGAQGLSNFRRPGLDWLRSFRYHRETGGRDDELRADQIDAPVLIGRTIPSRHAARYQGNAGIRAGGG